VTPIVSDTLLEELEDGIITLDPQQVIVDINPAPRQIYMLEGKDPIGQPLEAVTAGMPEEAERLRQQIANLRIETEQGDIPVTVSLGAAEMDAQNDENVDDLIHCAGTALYAAKKAGRNRVVCR
jgi:GGDEF domain-containing protein